MSLLFESVRVENGLLCNAGFHNERMARSVNKVFGISWKYNLESVIEVPGMAAQGLFKCRIEYDRKIDKIEFTPYTARSIKSLKLVEANNIEYSCKYTDRDAINAIYMQRGDSDDVIIVKNGMLTDTSFSNIILLRADGKWITPSSCLLKGTRISNMLSTGWISSEDVCVSDIYRYKEIRIVNAMIGFNDSPGISIEKICF